MHCVPTIPVLLAGVRRSEIIATHRKTLGFSKSTSQIKPPTPH